MYDELLYHLPNEMKTVFKKVKYSSFNGSDYRERLQATWFLQNHPFHFAADIVTTLAETHVD